MYEFTYENNGTNTYLVYEIGSEDKIDSMSLGMITNNKIPGIAPTIFTQMDQNKYIKYNVSSKITLQALFSGTVNRKRMIGSFKGIVDAFLSAEDYMLDNSSIILDVNYIFIDVSTNEVSMILLPMVGKQRTSAELCEFFKDKVYSIQSDVSEDCSHVAKMLNYLNSSATFSLDSFKTLLQGLDGTHTTSSINLVKPVNQIPAAAPVTVPPVTNPVVSAPVVTPQQPIIQTMAAPAAPAPVVPAAPAPVVPAPAPVNSAPQVNNPPKAAGGMAVPPKAAGGMAVPPKASTNAKANVNTTTTDGKDISLFYLLQHYNSDNAAAYKAQKEAKKAAKAGAQPPKNQAAPAKPPKNGKAQAAPVAQAPIAPAPVVQASPVPVQAPAAMPQMAVPPQPQVAVPQPQMQPQQFVTMPQTPIGSNFGETTVLGGGVAGETTVLGQANANFSSQPANPVLVRVKNSEVIRINKFPFRVGKERSFVDYFIGDNTAVSRSHAEFIKKDGSYFVKDMNSTNHTFVNGNMIQSGIDVQINVGDHIKFANEEFEFKLI